MPPYETDAFTGTHPGNAIILEETPFGDHEANPWTWNMFAKQTRHDRAGTQRTVPGRSEDGKPIRMRNIPV